MDLDKAFHNTFIKPILELDEQMTKLGTLSNVSEEKYNEILNEVKEIAVSYGYTVSGILGSILSGLMYGYSIDYVMDKVRNNQPIRNPFENFKSVKRSQNMDCLEMKKSAIQDWFAECLSIEDVAETYAELLCEIRKQMSYMINSFKDEDEDNGVANINPALSVKTPVIVQK